MKFLIPTAKEMRLTKSIDGQPLSEESKAILESIQSIDEVNLAKAYKIKPEQAKKEWQRWQDIMTQTATDFPAIQLFNGLMYRQIKRDKLSSAELDYLNKAVFITSAFYGIIPANYPIAEHRLDFNTSLKIKNQSLKTLWKEHYDNFLRHCTEPVVSLLSSEFEQVFSSQLRKKLFLVDFFEETTDGQLKKHSTISKKARGHFINTVIAQQSQTIDDLRKLQFADFHYRPELSTEQQLTFVKKLP